MRDSTFPKEGGGSPASLQITGPHLQVAAVVLHSPYQQPCGTWGGGRGGVGMGNGRVG